MLAEAPKLTAPQRAQREAPCLGRGGSSPTCLHPPQQAQQAAHLGRYSVLKQVLARGSRPSPSECTSSRVKGWGAPPNPLRLRNPPAGTHGQPVTNERSWERSAWGGWGGKMSEGGEGQGLRGCSEGQWGRGQVTGREKVRPPRVPGHVIPEAQMTASWAPPRHVIPEAQMTAPWAPPRHVIPEAQMTASWAPPPPPPTQSQPLTRPSHHPTPTSQPPPTHPPASSPPQQPRTSPPGACPAHSTGSGSVPANPPRQSPAPPPPAG
jgi:hypothetical protein